MDTSALRIFMLTEESNNLSNPFNMDIGSYRDFFVFAFSKFGSKCMVLKSSENLRLILGLIIEILLVINF